MIKDALNEKSSNSPEARRKPKTFWHKFGLAIYTILCLTVLACFIYPSMSSLYLIIGNNKFPNELKDPNFANVLFFGGVFIACVSGFVWGIILFLGTIGLIDVKKEDKVGKVLLPFLFLGFILMILGAIMERVLLAG